MRFEVTILGSSSATPIYNRNPSAQILNANDHFFLIDCGEGTQQQLLKNGIKAQKIDYIFISHLHGDHYLGLIGLLSSLHLNGRSKPITLFAPGPLKKILDLNFKYSETTLRYPVVFNPTQSEFSEVILETADLIVETVILEHRIPCTGFKFSQKKRLRKVIKEKLEELNIPISYIPLLKRGVGFTDETGRIYTSDELTTEADEPRSYAYCSDTICNWKYLDQIMGVDTLYHEATFTHAMADRAKETFHTTSLEAAQVAVRAEVKKQLLLGHFSARYKDLDPILEEAKTVFPNSRLAIEGQTFLI